ncbi:MAG: hypothetical protein BGO21_28255 [Dyadobacter sp. 50-39]|uniref:DUF2281 domain-containing protein n=1 Tax=Dyadobacter sp. 50-39 TaxID=1895756 RepID=UPI000968A78D|nr:DUF2281 domain-containing protein [Dyadobacter sp. 50-39]OJV16758.1 MAG: hypothetical protein BGO21_28255 [Dyadobacter sp. 50-39]
MGYVELYTKLSELSPANRKAVMKFIDSLPKERQAKTKRVAGLAKGLIEMKEGFDDPIDFTKI